MKKCGRCKKDFTIGNNLNYSIKRILSEIEKCIVVCANCHRIIHAEEKGRLL